MARAVTQTLLSLERYAQIMGIHPLHFSQGYSALQPALTECTNLWYQWDWQYQGQVSRETLAQEIGRAEYDLATVLKYWPAPVWIEDERQPYPAHYQPENYGLGHNVKGRLALLNQERGGIFRGEHKALRVNWGYVITGGMRRVTYLGDVRWSGIDADGDTFAEWAVGTLTVPTTTNVCQVHTYFTEYDVTDPDGGRTDPNSTGADPAWEIRSLFASLSGDTLTVRVPSWALFRPTLQEGFAAQTGIDGDDSNSYVPTFSVYAEDEDPEHQVEFLWGESACDDPTCAWATQAGCLRAKDPRLGLVVPVPGDYDAATESFSEACWVEHVEPDAVRLWYHAGWRPERPVGCELLDHRFANIIAHLATARLPKPLCACGGDEDRLNKWQEDLALSNAARNYNIAPADLHNPFGTRLGEVDAWRQLVRMGLAVGRAVRTHW